MGAKKAGGEQAPASTRWQPGQSGNPAGRPKGSRNRLTLACAGLLAADSEAIMARLIQRAKKGEDVALKLCVERLLPVRSARDRWVQLDLPAVSEASDLVGAAAAVVERAAAGDITLSEAKEFMVLVDAQRRAIETADLAVRIEALEASTAPPVKGGTVRVIMDDEERRQSLARIRSVIEQHREVK